MKAFVLHLGKKLWLIAASIIIIAAVLLTAARSMTPFLTEYKSDIEAWASRTLDAKLSIGEVKASWYYLEPMIKFKNVQLYDKSGKSPLLKNPWRASNAK